MTEATEKTEKKGTRKGKESRAVKWSAERKPLLEILQLMAGITVSNTAMPILQNVLIAISDQSLEFSATDLEVSLLYRTGPQGWYRVTTGGVLVVSADKMASVVREMSGDTVELRAEEGCLVLANDRDVFKILTAAEEEFPTLAVPKKKENSWQLPVAELVSMVGLTGFACAKERSRYTLNGIFFDFRRGGLNLVATDSRRLSLVSQEGAAGSPARQPKLEAIVPLKGLALLAKAGWKPEETVDVSLEENQIFFAAGGFVLGSRLLEGQFPNYEEALPANLPFTVEIPSAGFLGAVKRAALMASQDSRAVKLGLEKGRLVLQARSHQHGEAKVELALDYQGNALEIGFNPDYLLDFLRLVKTEKVTLLLSDQNSPGLFRAGPRHTYLVMPVCLD